MGRLTTRERNARWIMSSNCVQFGIDRFRRHKHQGQFLGFSGQKIFARNVGDVFEHSDQQSAGDIALVVGLGVAEGGDALEPEFRIDDQWPLIGKWMAQSGRELFDK